jgi:hypothetical protein
MSAINLVRGVWVYRSMGNSQSYVEDFNKLKVWEAELSLDVDGSGRIYGLLGERPAKAADNEPYLTVEGEVRDGNPVTVRWRAKGVPGSDFDGWVYDYLGFISPDWADATRSRLTMTGTVTRTVPHGNAPAGSVFSFYAVRREFVEPRTVIPLEKAVIAMMASSEHRHHHALWHASRDEWSSLSDTKKEALRALGWQPGLKGSERPSLSRDRLTNGSGEDFLYMHRRMVADVRKLDGSVQSWRRVPLPSFPVTFARDFTKEMAGNPDGNALPNAWHIPGDPDTTAWLVELRKTSTLYGRFQAWEAQYTDPRYLASVSLAELGSRIEFTIHNWMHMRWASVPRDPSTDPAKQGRPIPEGRNALDFDAKWLSPEYDYLGETFSSHVNPIFWRLHGWVDDRIDDWYRAQESMRPGTVKRVDLDGVSWFEADKTWVLLNQPWEGPRDPHAGHGGHGGGGSHGGLLLDVPTMQEALRVIFGPEAAPGPLAIAGTTSSGAARARATWFRRVE